MKQKINEIDLKAIENIELINFPNNSYNYNELKKFNNSDDFQIYIKKDFDLLIAYCIIFISQDYIEIYKILVDKNYRNRNIASDLILEIKSKYNKKIVIEVSDKDNTCEFYKKNGFTPIHFRKNYYSDKSNAYIMEWNPK